MNDNGTPPVLTRGSDRPRRRWLKPAGITAAVIVALLAGVGIGARANSHAGTVSTLRHELTITQGRLTSSQDSVSSWQSKAQQATAQAATAYAARNAALDQRAATLKHREQALAAAEGRLQASSVSGDGVYVVGKDIKPGLYHTRGSGDTGQDDCYYATLNSTSTNDIADNNNFDGAETIDVSGAYAFQISGPCTWVRTG
jgi:hypothetical protein